MEKYLKKIIDFCQEYDMLPQSGSVLCCVSGGADSMCLLGVLNTLSKELGFSLYAAHFNHNLRGEESDGDERFVRSFCAELGVPCFSGSGDVSSEAKKRGTGIEETARDMRYAFFSEVCFENSIDKIATAHTADDNLETVLMRIARGTGLTGLAGIPPVRGNIIRPILCLSREQVEEYNRENSIPHREDSSNLSDDYARNRIRHHVIPVLRELNPEVSAVSADMAAILRRDADYLSAVADEFIALNVTDNSVQISKLSALPFSVASRVIKKRCGSGLSYDHVTTVLKLIKNSAPSASLSLPGISVQKEYDRLVFGEVENISFEPFELNCGENVFLKELSLYFSAELIPEIKEIYKSLNTFLLKCGNIDGSIIVRPRKTGDRIRLSESSGSKSLKKLFIDKKIPLHLRSCIPVICDESGPIAIPGIGCDVRAWPSPGDSVIKIHVEEILTNA